ncbi:MAG: hypothetical protein AAF806_20815 [Bacteroidota bacterium]
MKMNGTRERSSAMDGKIYDAQLFYDLNEEGKREYIISCVFSFKRRGVKVGKVTKVDTSDAGVVEVWFHVYEDEDSNEEFLAFAGRIGELEGENNEEVAIKRYLIIHPERRTEPDKKPKGKVMTGSAKPKI